MCSGICEACLEQPVHSGGSRREASQEKDSETHYEAASHRPITWRDESALPRAVLCWLVQLKPWWDSRKARGGAFAAQHKGRRPRLRRMAGRATHGFVALECTVHTALYRRHVHGGRGETVATNHDDG